MAQNDQRLEQLKQKYQSVLNLVNQLQIRTEHVHMQNDKLFIQGEAPSEQAKNKLWDQIKLVDPTFSDLTADIRVSAQPQSMTAGAAVSGGSARRYTVKPGDSLSKIAKQFYGSANDYLKIFEANRGILTDPNKIQPGQELTIPD